MYTYSKGHSTSSIKKSKFVHFFSVVFSVAKRVEKERQITENKVIVVFIIESTLFIYKWKTVSPKGSVPWERTDRS
jgi:hypothetical protein